ncbi:MAG: transcription-repair coupling factor, partial [Armatimonadetes bacterium]|nr:transcription-repair coupling factor [Armatimonadota bacterium]
FDYLPADAMVVIDEPARVRQAAEQFHENLSASLKAAAKLGTRLRLPDSACMTWEALSGRYLTREPWRGRIVYLSMIRPQVDWEPRAEAVDISMPPTDSYGGKIELLVQGVQEQVQAGGTVLVCTRQVQQTLQALVARGLQSARLLAETDVLRPGGVYVADAELTAGFSVPSVGLTVLTSREVFGWHKIRRGDERTYRPGFSVTSLRELREGDYVVHINHGIGIYRGIVRETIDGIDREYLLIEYAEQDKLYVPVTQLDRIQKYVGVEGKPPTIHSLRTKQWLHQKRRARRSALRLAQELLMLYQTRERAKKQPIAADSLWLSELEASFHYEETPDQLRAIQDIKADLAQPRPADRLICGDVGFGKTEVAVRAAFMVVLHGKQVAVLVPTTVLAEQHYHTFTERLSAYPVRIEMLSRFKERSEQQRIIEGLKTGDVDIVIGTHRLLMSDVHFKDLGLLIIDEEQRFGVEQKERLKKLRHNVDVITLTATPIPRTLNMALSGIRDITVINDPPLGRLPVRTYVRERDDELIRTAIRRELARGGQVYFVHNRVQSIPHVAAQVQRLVPEARVAVAHGQMPDEDLERVMLAFYAHEIDVLVCTTIVENGLDVPNANTIIVDDADRLGLAQLHQLRGRVGRADRQAYAYLLYRYPEHLTPEAEQRLRAIEEFAELGAGLKVAMRDLEIRGSGNLLGPEQSGHIAAVGLDLFCEMLAESVRTLRGHAAYLGDPHATIDLPVPAIIGADYIPQENVRIAAYRRLGACQSHEEIDAVAAELEDRFGRMPRSVRNLVRLGHMRIKCWQAGATEIVWRNPKAHIILDDSARLSERECRLLVALYRRPTTSRRMVQGGHHGSLVQFTATPHEITFAADRHQPDALLDAVDEVLDRLVDRAKERQQRTAPRVATSGS